MTKTMDPTGVADFVARPWRGPGLIAAVALIVVAGALYCMGYDAIQSGNLDWSGSLFWAVHAILPWFILYEWIKRRGATGQSPSMYVVATLFAATLIGSLVVEATFDYILATDRSPLALQVLRRVPAILATALLLLIAVAAGRRADKAEPEEMFYWFTANAARISRVSAADNYVEVHMDGAVVTRRCTLASVQGTLEAKGFARVHRSHLVNAKEVTGFSGSGRHASLQLSDGSVVPVGTKYRAEASRRFEIAPSPQLH